MPIIKTDSQEYKDWLAALKPDDVVGVRRGQGYGDPNPNPFEPVLASYTVERMTPKRLVLGRGGALINRGTGRSMAAGYHRFHIYPWTEADQKLRRAWTERHELRGLAPYLFRRLSDEGTAAVLAIIRNDPHWLKTQPAVKP